MRTLWSFFFVLGVVVSFSYCSLPVTPSEQDSTDGGEASGDLSVSGCSSGKDCKTGQICRAGVCVAVEAVVEVTSSEPQLEQVVEPGREAIVEPLTERSLETKTEPTPEPVKPEDAGFASEERITLEPGPEPSGSEPVIESPPKELVPEKSNVPTASSLNPKQLCGTKKVTVVAKGSGFVSKTQARLQTVPLPTTVKNCCELSFVIDLSFIPPGNYKVEICNPPNDCSKELDLKVLHPSKCP